MRPNTVADVKYLVSAHLTRRRNAFDPPWGRSFPRGQWRCGEDFRLLEHTFFAERSDEISLLGDSGIFVHISPLVKRLQNENVANYLNFFTAEGNRYDTIRVACEGDLDEMIPQTAVATACRVVSDCGIRLLERPITAKTASLYLTAVRGPVRLLDLYLRHCPDLSNVRETLESHERAIRRIEESGEPTWRTFLRRLPEWYMGRLTS